MTKHLLGAVCAPRQEQTELRCMHVLYTCTDMQCDHETIWRHWTLTATEITRCIICKFVRCVATDHDDCRTAGATTVDGAMTTSNKRKS